MTKTEKERICGKLRNQTHRNLYYNGYQKAKKEFLEILQNIKKRLKKDCMDKSMISVDELFIGYDEVEEIIDKVFSEEAGDDLLK